eukprot:11845033-Alexandrium_andersonii.AAC.1
MGGALGPPVHRRAPGEGRPHAGPDPRRWRGARALQDRCTCRGRALLDRRVGGHPRAALARGEMVRGRGDQGL